MPTFKSNAKAMMGHWVVEDGCPWDKARPPQEGENQDIPATASAPPAPQFDFQTEGGSSSSASGLFQFQLEDLASAPTVAPGMFSFKPEGGDAEPRVSDPIIQTDPPDVDLRRSLRILGILHVVNNISEG